MIVQNSFLCKMDTHIEGRYVQLGSTQLKMLEIALLVVLSVGRPVKIVLVFFKKERMKERKALSKKKSKNAGEEASRKSNGTAQ